MDKLLLSLEATAETLSIRRTLLYRLLDEGSIATVMIGRRRLVPRDSLERYIAEQRVEPETNAAVAR